MAVPFLWFLPRPLSVRVTQHRSPDDHRGRGDTTDDSFIVWYTRARQPVRQRSNAVLKRNPSGIWTAGVDGMPVVRTCCFLRPSRRTKILRKNVVFYAFTQMMHFFTEARDTSHPRRLTALRSIFALKPCVRLFKNRCEIQTHSIPLLVKPSSTFSPRTHDTRSFEQRSFERYATSRQRTARVTAFERCTEVCPRAVVPEI